MAGDAQSVLEAAVANAGEITQTSSLRTSRPPAAIEGGSSGNNNVGASEANVGATSASGAATGGSSGVVGERPSSRPRSRTRSFDFVLDLSHVDETTPLTELLHRVRTLQASCRRLLERALAAEAENVLLRSTLSEDTAENTGAGARSGVKRARTG